MTSIDVQNIIERQDQARKFVSAHSSGHGGVGNCTPEDGNVAVVIQVVEGRSTKIKVGDFGEKVTRSKSRIVEQDGNMFFVSGGIGDNVRVDEALPFIPEGKREALVESLARDKKRKKEKLQIQ